MELKSDRELVNTRAKLQKLLALDEANEKKTGGDEELREMTMQSLMRLINQLMEEIARYESHQAIRN
jgi:hypothetical protein